MNISDFIPFTQEFTIDNNRVYLKNDKDILNFKIYGEITDRLIFLAGATIGLPVQLAATILLIARAATFFITELFNNHDEGKQFLKNYLVNFKYILALSIGAVYFEVSCIFGVFFPNDAKKICFSIEQDIHEEAIFSSVFDPRKAPIARRSSFNSSKQYSNSDNHGGVCSRANHSQQGHNGNDAEPDS